jgi:hypothetical protein
MFRSTYDTLVHGHEPLEIRIARLAKSGYDVVGSSIISIFTPERDIVSTDEAFRQPSNRYEAYLINRTEAIEAQRGPR